MVMIGDCPTNGQVVLGYGDIRALVNLEPGVIVLWWDCPCGRDHVTATGRVAEQDPVQAERAVRAVRAGLDADATAPQTRTQAGRDDAAALCKREDSAGPSPTS